MRPVPQRGLVARRGGLHTNGFSLSYFLTFPYLKGFCIIFREGAFPNRTKNSIWLFKIE
jgi:hypothetical protein